MHWIDPDSLPETVGQVELFLINPRGEVDGMMLADGTEVHLPPHMGADLVGALRPGSTVRLRAVRPRGADLLAAVAFETADGRRYEDQGPPKDHPRDRKPARGQAAPPKTHEAEIQGVVRRRLHGPKGETRGLLLCDGRSGRFPPHAAAGLAPLLREGAAIVLRGPAVVTAHGTVVAVREIGGPGAKLHRIGDKPGKPKPPHPPGKPHHAHAARQG